MTQRTTAGWPMDAIPQAPSPRLQAGSLTPGLDAFREAVALVLTALAGHSEPMARDAAALSGMAGDVMGNRHAATHNQEPHKP